MTQLYQSEKEIEQVVSGFEACTTAAADFHHPEHLTVAVWYLQTLSRQETVDAIRTALLRFVDHHRVDRKKYSEEVTVFWVDAVASVLEEIGAQASLAEKCNQVIGALASVSSPTRTPTLRVAGEE